MSLESAHSQGSDYADPSSCERCHEEIARTYRLTGMARSFSKAQVDRIGVRLQDGTLHHAASDRYYTMFERDGRLYQRRHEIGFGGKEAGALEVEADYVMGSGNHARTFIHRDADGRLRQMPLTWYTEGGGFWAMSPGYDRAAHLDFRRLIAEDCMSCHNGYPRAGVKDEGNGPRFAEPLPDGIDCQRCHGPGRAHVESMQSNDLEAGRRAIANPGRFDRRRQLETCLQCHLEPTSSPLPFQIRRYEHPPFSFTPGHELGDYFIYFDHAPGSGREDKFEIAGGAYRLRRSACFQRSEMTCVTCHDPHDIPRGERAVRHYVAVCQSCHQGAHAKGVPATPRADTSATCIDCHMPKRRAEDAVHVVMTDHYIQRTRPSRDLLAPRSEAENFEHGAYRGEVTLYYPPKLPQTSENELYLALAQVQQGSNLAAGIPRLERAIATLNPQRPDFYYELARAYSKIPNYEADLRWCEEALRRDPGFAPALKELAGAATALGRLDEAARALEKAVTLRPKDADAFADLGNVYLQSNRVDAARRALQQALALDPRSPRANNTMALALLKNNDTTGAESFFRAALASQPDLAEAQNNLGNLLAARKAYAEAGYHFEKAIGSDPNYVEARRSYGLVLALGGAYANALTHLEAAVRLAPGLAEAHTDLADVLASMGRVSEAAREYEIAIKLDPNDQSARLGLEALRR